MGAWAATAFGNDDACDFVFDLADLADPARHLHEVFDAAISGDEVEEPTGSYAIAGAALVAMAFGSAIDAPEDAIDWIRGKESSLQPLAAKAARAVRRIAAGGSEVRELWMESGSGGEWVAHLEGIASALERATIDR